MNINGHAEQLLSDVIEILGDDLPARPVLPCLLTAIEERMCELADAQWQELELECRLLLERERWRWLQRIKRGSVS